MKTQLTYLRYLRMKLAQVQPVSREDWAVYTAAVKNIRKAYKLPAYMLNAKLPPVE